MKEEMDEKAFYRMKLMELQLIKKQMFMARSSEEEMEDINKMIKTVEKEYARVLIEEKKEGKTK